MYTQNEKRNGLWGQLERLVDFQKLYFETKCRMWPNAKGFKPSFSIRCKGDRRVNTMSDELAGDPKRFSHYAVMLNTYISSRGSKEERIRIPLLAWPNIHSK